MAILYLLGGLIALIAGGEFLVRGASVLARFMRLSSFVIGLSVVAFGTSSPELAVSIRAVLEGADGISLGNVIGSNIFNVLFILGVAAVISPLTVARQAVRVDVPVMIGASVVTALFALDNRIDRIEGAILVFLLLVYLVVLFRLGRENAGGKSGSEAKVSLGRMDFPVLWIVVGLGLLVLGAKWLVGGAVEIATKLSVPPLVVGLTIVAVGTSLPEVAVSVIASLRGERDIAVGNVVGSNIFNLFGVLGLAAWISPTGLSVSPNAIQFDFPVMVGVALVCLPIFFTGSRISRWEGVLFLAWYVAYLVFLLLSSLGHPLLRTFTWALAGFALPLTVIGIGVSFAVAFHKWQTERGDGSWLE
jgi:cation:H+ antiporter